MVADESRTWAANMKIEKVLIVGGGIAGIFFLRAVGEFKLVGFFKRASDTPFAYWDTWLFSPLCLVIAIIAFALVYSEA